VHEPALEGGDDCLRSITHLQTFKDRTDMALHGGFGNAKGMRNVLVALASY